MAASSDPLLTRILQARTRSSGGPSRHSLASRPSSNVALEPWVVAFEDIQFHSCIGQASGWQAGGWAFTCCHLLPARGCWEGRPVMGSLRSGLR